MKKLLLLILMSVGFSQMALCEELAIMPIQVPLTCSYFKLFPRETHFIELVESLQDNEYIARGYYDAQDDKVYAELLLDKPAPDYVYPLLVEEDLYWVKDEIALEEIHQYTGEDYDISKDKLLDNDYYQIKADSIAFDSSLGENGGYQIVLEK